MAYGRFNDDIIDDVTRPWKVKVMIPISLRPIISKTAWDRVGYNGAPIGNGKRGIEWSRDRWQHVTEKGQGRDLVIFRCKYLENGFR